MFRPWLELARVSNLPTVWTNVLAAWFLAGGKWEWQPLAWLLAGGSLVYTGGMFLNDAADVKFDREHRAERPIPSGRASLASVWLAGLIFLAVGGALMIFQAGVCPWLTGALVLAILVYDFWHKRWSGSVFVMGSCRTLLFLAVASAPMTDAFDWTHHKEVMLRAIALGGYVTGLSLAARSESKTQSQSTVLNRLGIFGLWLPALTSVVLFLIHGSPRTHWAMLLWILPLGFLILSCRRLMRSPPPSNIGRAVGLFLAGIAWVDAMAVSSVSPALSLVFALALPLHLVWQRKIAAT